MRVVAVATLSLFLGATSWAQQKPTLDAAFRDMYNLQFDAAHQVLHGWQKANPQDPLGYTSDAAAYLFSEFDRLHILETEFFTDDQKFENRAKLVPDPNVKREFENRLETADRLASDILKKDPNNTEALFSQVMALGLRGDYAALIEKRDMAGLNYMKTGRALAEKLLSINSQYYDAYLAVGVENYLLSLHAAPIRWVLRMTGAQTDREAGLAKLRLTAEKGHYLLPFARLLLAVAALRDKEKARAKDLLAGLASEYPQNHLYAEELAKIQ